MARSVERRHDVEEPMLETRLPTPNVGDPSASALGRYTEARGLFLRPAGWRPSERRLFGPAHFHVITGDFWGKNQCAPGVQVVQVAFQTEIPG